MIAHLLCLFGSHDVRKGLYQRTCRRDGCHARWIITYQAGVAVWVRNDRNRRS